MQQGARREGGGAADAAGELGVAAWPRKEKEAVPAADDDERHPGVDADESAGHNFVSCR